MKVSRVDRITWKIMKVLKYPPDVEQWGTAAVARELAKIVHDELKRMRRKTAR